MWVLRAQAGLARPIASGLLLAARSSIFAIVPPIVLACSSSDMTIVKSDVQVRCTSLQVELEGPCRAPLDL